MKCFGCGTGHKPRTTAPADAEETGFGSANLFPYYVSSRSQEAPKVTIGKNAKYQLVTATILKGFNFTTNNIPNLQNMGFINHDLQKFPELDMNWYMTTVCETKDGPIHVVPMDWERGLHKYGLFSLMHMPPFGHTT